MKDSKEERNMNMEMKNSKEDEKENYTSSNGNNTNHECYYHNLLLGPYEYLEKVVRVILRFLGIQHDFSTPPTPPYTADDAPTTATSATSATTTTTTTTTTITTVTDDGVKEGTCPAQTPDLGGAGGDGGDGYSVGGDESSTGAGMDTDTGTDQPVAGADGSPPEEPVAIETQAIKKPPKPGVSSGKPGQIH